MSYEEEMRAALGSFVVEARDLLQEMEEGLLSLEAAPEQGDTAEVVNAVFRAAHTIKGSSGLFGLEPIVRFTHVVESVLDRLRLGSLPVTSDLVGALLPCQDHISGLIEAVARGELDAADHGGGHLLAGLQRFLDGDGSGDAGHVEAAPAAGAAPSSPAVRPHEAAGSSSTPAAGADETDPALPDPDGGARRIHLSLRFGPDSLRNGMDPLSFVRYVSTLGTVVQLVPVADLLPDAAHYDPETCYLGFEITLVTWESDQTILDVFDFVRADSQIVLLSNDSTVDDFMSLLESFGEHPAVAEQVAALIGSSGISPRPAAPAAEPDPAAGAADDAATVPAQRGAGSTTSSPTPAPAVAGPAGPLDGAAAQPREPASYVQRQPVDRRVSESRNIRIDAERLDRLIDGVGELVIAGASASLQASLNGDETLVGLLGEVMRLVEEVRDRALQLRMVPIGTTFSRFQRVVRDVSSSLGKDVQLVITGGETEVDKALVERIGDPLTHLVRNSLDHGVETPQERLDAGKPARGTVRLNAYHDSGSIVIEVQDDGRGMDPARLVAKAVERGIVEPGTTMTDKEAYNLIFEPGFSTASAVSDLSGRGVGMDVVKRNVSALRGTIEIDSKVGMGTTMQFRLPLTLAIIDGFLVGVAGASFIVPLDRVVECVEVPAGLGAKDCMDLRGTVLPFVRLRQLFQLTGEPQRRECVVVVEHAGQKTGLVVDALMGEYQTVIKPLGPMFDGVAGIGGSTILGNGDVALILDVSALVAHAATTAQAAWVG